MIDVANRYRQGLLATERVWCTLNWRLRIFQTVMGIMLCNALTAYKYFEKAPMHLETFVDLIAQGLLSHASEAQAMKDSQSAVSPCGKTLRPRQSDQKSVDEVDHDGVDHGLYSCRDFGVGTLRDGKGKCKICRAREAYHFCQTCSRGGKKRGGIFFVCAPGHHQRQCYALHLHKMLAPSP